jgi:hypothetical protein
MAVPLQVLQSLASTFSAVREGPQQIAPGQPVNVQLVPASASDLHATDVLTGALDLTWVTKNVRFTTPNTEPAMSADPFVPASIDALLTGGMPARVPLLGSVAGFQDLPGTPGEIAQLAGDFPIAVEVPVGLAVTWQVLDSGGVVLAEGPGTFTSPTGTGSPAVTFVFAHQTIELTSTMTIPLTRRFIRATVTLTAGTTTHSFTLPDIPVDIPAIPIPTVIVFFLHTNFAAADGDDDGAAFIVVPNNSPLRSLGQLQNVLNTLESTVSALTSVAELAAFLLGLSELTGSLAAQPHVQFRVTNAANQFNNFNDVTLIQRGLLSNDTEAEDELSSLIFIGAGGARVSCFRDRSRRGRSFTLTTGAGLHVIIRNLHSSSPAIEPAAPPFGGSIALSSGSSSFGDELSSLSFP